jgi:hypothetical protein
MATNLDTSLRRLASHLNKQSARDAQVGDIAIRQEATRTAPVQSGTLLLPLLSADPPAPATGALIYVFDTGAGVELRVRTAAGITTIGP